MKQLIFAAMLLAGPCDHADRPSKQSEIAANTAAATQTASSTPNAEAPAPSLAASGGPSSSGGAPAAVTCADVHASVMGRFPGLLPSGFPNALAPHFVYVFRKKGQSTNPPHPVLIGGEPLFVEHQIENGRALVSKANGNARDPVATIELPKFDGTPASSFRFAVAAGKGTLLIAAIEGKEAFAHIIDRKTWKVRSSTALKVVEPENSLGLDHIHAAYGNGAFGIAVHGSPDGAKWTHSWMILGEDGKLRGKRRYLKSSTYVEPLVAWDDANFVMLGGRTGDAGPRSIGVWIFGTDDSIEPRYVNWIDGSAGGSLTEQLSLYAGGFLVAKGGEFHLGFQAGRMGKPNETQLVHGKVNGTVRVETCPTE